MSASEPASHALVAELHELSEGFRRIGSYGEVRNHGVTHGIRLVIYTPVTPDEARPVAVRLGRRRK
ncbi:MAG TPA: hypothetical protein VFX59_26670 [Polyangiales bacterium]|nr:hypothetical protein [Polyangiales bacterium]